MKRNVAICQSFIQPGGRLRVVLGMIQVLKDMGIEPTVLTYKMILSPTEIKGMYGISPGVKFIKLPHVRLPFDYATMQFNWALPRHTSPQDLLISTTNSLAFLPKNNAVISYVFYLRENHIKSNALSIHEPDKTINRLSTSYFSRLILRAIYSFSRLHSSHQIVRMTEFSGRALETAYPGVSAELLPLVYPPVELDMLNQSEKTERQNSIVTVGRFAPPKRQLEQIKLASKLPDMIFHIIGFVESQAYYAQCKSLIEELNLENVVLHPNASFGEMVNLFHQSKYFLHTLINEHFGLTAVQAIAAGCLPVVHNSGGQTETVPMDLLRYDNLSEVPDILNRLNNMYDSEVSDLKLRLMEHARQNFDVTVFNAKIRKLLDAYFSRDLP